MVGRNVVPQPTVVLGVVFRRISFAFVSRGLGERIPEDLVNCVA